VQWVVTAPTVAGANLINFTLYDVNGQTPALTDEVPPSGTLRCIILGLDAIYPITVIDDGGTALCILDHTASPGTPGNIAVFAWDQGLRGTNGQWVAPQSMLI
jgi:hypothetical protein